MKLATCSPHSNAQSPSSSQIASRTLLSLFKPNKTQRTVSSSASHATAEWPAPRLPVSPAGSCNHDQGYTANGLEQRRRGGVQLDVRAGVTSTYHPIEVEQLPSHSVVEPNYVGAVEEDLMVVELATPESRDERRRNLDLIKSEVCPSDYDDKRRMREVTQQVDKKRRMLEEDRAISEALKTMGF